MERSIAETATNSKQETAKQKAQLHFWLSGASVFSRIWNWGALVVAVLWSLHIEVTCMCMCVTLCSRRRKRPWPSNWRGSGSSRWRGSAWPRCSGASGSRSSSVPSRRWSVARSWRRSASGSSRSSTPRPLALSAQTHRSSPGSRAPRSRSCPHLPRHRVLGTPAPTTPADLRGPPYRLLLSTGHWSQDPLYHLTTVKYLKLVCKIVLVDLFIKSVMNATLGYCWSLLG